MFKFIIVVDGIKANVRKQHEHFTGKNILNLKYEKLKVNIFNKKYVKVFVDYLYFFLSTETIKKSKLDKEDLKVQRGG